MIQHSTTTSDLAKSVATSIIDAARQHDFIDGTITVAEELTKNEQLLFSVIAKMTREHVDAKAKHELEIDELHSMFLFVYAKACEAACDWHSGKEYSLNPTGLFSGTIPIQAPPEITAFFQEEKAGDILFATFQTWSTENAEIVAESKTHPILPLLEALKWTYRVSVGMALDFQQEWKE